MDITFVLHNLTHNDIYVMLRTRNACVMYL